ncbi:cupin domain-containing protein [Aneurinibacillus aneurinilyticus]|jgi:oxalate decarboxylase|uniref:cupin domain-containing protein n=1 Tax=Aneurinibacillus aneurinilyticus TaxID=1391 RepID=UPI0023F7FBC1|nr:cupin domain-containing protein [Aneurinibacillus aneurinilyticus]MCI1694184.1 cupin domain-containing protein [Aneurinibacillus aneurinilyticus]
MKNLPWNQAAYGYAPQPIRDDGAGATDPGPRDIMRDIENPDMLVPPATDSGLVPNLKFSFSDTNMTLNHGGWSREITVRELPIATTLAGVNMRLTPGGSVRIADSSNFPISKTIAAALVELQPGAMRELHWHPNNDEWQYYLTGQGRMTVFAGNGVARTFDYRAGDVGYVPFAFGHYIQNTGTETLWYLEIFKSDRFADVSLNQWMALTPRDLVRDNLNVGPELLDVLRKEKWPVVKYPGFSYYPRNR